MQLRTFHVLLQEVQFHKRLNQESKNDHEEKLDLVSIWSRMMNEFGTVVDTKYNMGVGRTAVFYHDLLTT